MHVHRDITLPQLNTNKSTAYRFNKRIDRCHQQWASFATFANVWRQRQKARSDGITKGGGAEGGGDGKDGTQYSDGPAIKLNKTFIFYLCKR